MRKLLLFFLMIGCGAREVPIITGSTSQESLVIIPESDLHMALTQVVEESLVETNSSDQNLKLEIITLGVALDSRVGVGELNMGASTGVDLHFKRIGP